MHLRQVVDEKVCLDLIFGTEVPADRTTDARRWVVLFGYELINTFAAVVVQASEQSVWLDHCLQAHCTLKILLIVVHYIIISLIIKRQPFKEGGGTYQLGNGPQRNKIKNENKYYFGGLRI